MGKGNTKPESGSNHNPQTIYVARTIRRNERRLHRFNKDLATGLGRTASIKAVESMHVTFMSTHWIRNMLRGIYSTRPEMRALAAGLEKELISATGRTEIVATVDAERPLAALGKNGNLLGLMLIADPVLTEQRAVIDNYFVRLLGVEMPHMVPFMPHITLGKVYDPAAVETLQRQPGLLVPDMAVMPRTVALNGIECFLGRIHDQEHTL